MYDTDLALAYYVLLAEFDIDTGPCLRAKYPPVTLQVEEAEHVEGNTLCGIGQGKKGPIAKRPRVWNLDDSYCAAHMLPDGAEKQVVSRTIFIANRSSTIHKDSFPVYGFRLGEGLSLKEIQIDSPNAGKSLEWVRDARPEEFYLPEELHYNQRSREMCVCSQGGMVFGPVIVSTTEIIHIVPTAPMSILSFVHHLQKNGSLVDGLDVSGNSMLVPEMDPTLSMQMLGYSFIVIHDASEEYYGYLLRSSELELFLNLVKASVIRGPRGVGQEGGAVAAAAAGGEEGVKRELLITESLDNVESSNAPPLYGLCAVVTRKDSSVRRGGISKSVALLGPKLVWLEAFFPLLVETALQCCDIKGKTEEALEQQNALVRRCFEAIEGTTCSWKKSLQKVNLDSLELEVIRLSTLNGEGTHIPCIVSPFGSMHNVQIPLSCEMNEFSFSRYGLEQMVEVCGASFWIVVMAILLEKRIVVLSRQGLPNDVCEATLSIGLIGNMLDPNFITRKVFPYTSVNGFLHFSNVTGYIVGTLNPIFETQHAWWDVLCDLDNKCVMVSSEFNSIHNGISDGGNSSSSGVGHTTHNTAVNTIITVNNNSNSNNTSTSSSIGGSKVGTWSAHDVQFYRDILSKVYRMKALRKKSSERNEAVRLILEEYLSLIIMTSEAHDYPVARCIQNNFLTPTMTRLRALAQRGSMRRIMPRHFLFPGEDPLLIIAVATLRRASSCDGMELIRTLNHLLSFVCSYKEVLILIRRMPLALGGLNPLASQLLHSLPMVRQAALELMRRVEVFPLGRDAIASMNNFLCMAYEAASREA